MSPKRAYTFMIEPEMAEALKRAKERDPELTEGAIIRKALREWLDKNEPKATKKRRT